MTRKYDWLIVLAFAIAGLTLAHWVSDMAEKENVRAENIEQMEALKRP